MTENKHGYLLVIKTEPDSKADYDFMSYIAWNIKVKRDVVSIGGVPANRSEDKMNSCMIEFRYMEDLADAYCYVKKELNRRKHDTWDVFIMEQTE